MKIPPSVTVPWLLTVMAGLLSAIAGRWLWLGIATTMLVAMVANDVRLYRRDGRW